jgi:hypothetical protein
MKPPVPLASTTVETGSPRLLSTVAARAEERQARMTGRSSVFMGWEAAGKTDRILPSSIRMRKFPEFRGFFPSPAGVCGAAMVSPAGISLMRWAWVPLCFFNFPLIRIRGGSRIG